MATEQTIVDDGTYDWQLGQDSWHHPDRIQDGQYWAGINVTTKGGTLSPRPGYTQINLSFDNTSIVNKYGYTVTAKTLWTSGKFQALIPYVSGIDEYVITIINGYIFKTNLVNGFTRLLSTTIRVDPYVPRINWSFASGKIVIFDYPAYPLILDNESLTRSDINHKINGFAAPQVPIATIGTYNENRLFVANAGVEFTAGDPVGNLATPEAPITFTEVLVPGSPFYQQVFSLPVEESIYPITAMGFIQSLDSSTGIGQLFIGTQKKLYTYQTAQPRSNWGQGSFGSVLLANAGIAGPRSFVNVNSDLIFLTPEGNVHALSTARNNAQTWGNTPISREVAKFLKYTDPSLSKYAALGYFNNRIFITANPYRVTSLTSDLQPISDYAHGGLVVLELEQLASLSSDGNPVWAGLWTGLDAMDICNVNDKCIAIGKIGLDDLASNALFFLERERTTDIVSTQERRVTSVIYTKQYNFGNDFALKQSQSVSMHLQDIEGKLDLKIENKPTHASNWLLQKEWNYEAPTVSCDLPTDDEVNGLASHQFRELIFGDAEETGCSPITQDDYTTFRGIQYRLTITANFWLLENFKTRARVIPFVERQDEKLCNEPMPIIKIPLQCSPDWLLPENSICPQ